MLTRITNLEVIPPFGLSVRFNDGSGGVHDCAALVAAGRGMMAELRDPAFFARAKLEFGAVAWPNLVDMDAEWLRREMISAGELQPAVAAE